MLDLDILKGKMIQLQKKKSQSVFDPEILRYYVSTINYTDDDTIRRLKRSALILLQTVDSEKSGDVL